MERNINATDIVQKIIEEAIVQKASDIHFLPQIDTLRVRLRIDGLLYDLQIIPKRFQFEIIARLKVLASLRSDEHFKAQDGRFPFVFEGENIDIRISIIPTYCGENAVLRLLSKKQTETTLEELGFSLLDIEKISEALKYRSGLILLTGPTGSGKTSTLYTLLQLLRNDTSSLITIEDPIEYAVPGITQVQVNESFGMHFASALRGILRQDPDVIMVGEIRDAETAKVAVNAALTGHLIFSTLHTGDAVGVVPRLRDMGIEPYLIAGTVKLVIAQRLVRKVQGGYFAGRTVVAETMQMTEKLGALIIKNSSLAAIRKQTISDGMQEMILHGKQKVESGITTFEEVLRVLHE